ncbi:hypothetical protein WG923_15265 [Ramlibacter sp. AN1133]|uniref:A1S_2505 family phage non-structural protein n=1 Tax=Ramlibacter sp. AN1133 TaxID=3133429 RepID=UPI0030BB397D
MNFRAQYGVGAGPTGQAYAIPTKDGSLNVLSIEQVRSGVREFLEYARANPKKDFFVTAVGTGLAGYSDNVMGPLFASAPPNCSLPQQWRPFVEQVRGAARPAAPAAAAPEPA